MRTTQIKSALVLTCFSSQHSKRLAPSFLTFFFVFSHAHIFLGTPRDLSQVQVAAYIGSGSVSLMKYLPKEHDYPQVRVRDMCCFKVECVRV